MPENISVNSKVVIGRLNYIVVARATRPKRYGFIIEDAEYGRLSLLTYDIQYNEWISNAAGITHALDFVKVEDGVFFFTIFEEG